MFKLVPILLALLIIPCVCYGRLGETEKEIETRFGKGLPQSDRVPVDKSLRYHVPEVLISVSYIGGKSVDEAYLKTTFSDLDVETLLRANAPNSTSWKQTRENNHREWTRNDGEAVASLKKRPVCYILEFKAKAYRQAEASLEIRKKDLNIYPHLGQTQAEIASLCGKGRAVRHSVGVDMAEKYVVTDYEVQVDYIGGKCVGESFTKVEDFSEAEIHTLLAANCPKGLVWNVCTDKGIRAWLRSDELAFAGFDPCDGYRPVLSFVTPDKMRRKKEIESDRRP